MSSTYTAWNGEERGWPPPDNWYRAADGRWWHPAYGPDDPPPDDDTQPIDSGDSNGMTSRQPGRDALDRDDELSESLPVWEAADDQRIDTMEAVVAGIHVAEIDASTSRAADTEPVSDRRPEPRAEPDAGRRPSDWRNPMPNAELETEPPTRHPWATVAAIAGIVLIVAAVAQIVLDRSTNDVATTQDSEQAEATGVEDETVDPASDGADVDDTMADTSSAEADLTADEQSQSESDPNVAATVANFRLQLSERGLSTEELADSQITTFASTYCVYATGAEDRAAFDELRQVAVTTSKSSLTPEQLNLTITAALMVFCPDESERLGINYESSP